MARIEVTALLGLLGAFLVTASLALAPGGAMARPKPLPRKPSTVKLLPHRSCKGLLSIGDFPGAATEAPGVGGLFEAPGSFATFCGYYPAETQPTAAEPEPPPPTGGGEDALAVYPRVEYAPQGKPIDIAGELVGRIDRDTNTVTLLHGIGTHAYLVINEEGDGTGILQVRNDLFEVFKEGVAGMPGLLAEVAHELE
jgi:hypothetical protein